MVEVVAEELWLEEEVLVEGSIAAGASGGESIGSQAIDSPPEAPVLIALGKALGAATSEPGEFPSA